MTKLTVAMMLLTILPGIGASQTRRPDRSSISAANGVSYELIGTRLSTEMNAGLCGYHDLSLANGATFRVETRLYHEYRDGRLIRSWQKEVKVFVRCHEL